MTDYRFFSLTPEPPLSLQSTILRRLAPALQSGASLVPFVSIKWPK
jgi:hypothetical protein